MASTNDFIDKWGFVKTKKSQETTGNGLLYSVIAMCLFKRFPPPTPPIKNGLLMRTPDNAFGQESHDNYMALAIYYLLTKNPRGARSMLWSMVMRFGYMKNVPLNFEGKDTWKKKATEILAPLMLRFPSVWFAMIAAAFPVSLIIVPCRALINLLLSFQTLNLVDASGVQLTWLYKHTLKLMGNELTMAKFLTELRDKNTSIGEVMLSNLYYDRDHFILMGYNTYTDGVFNGLQE